VQAVLFQGGFCTNRIGRREFSQANQSPHLRRYRKARTAGRQSTCLSSVRGELNLRQQPPRNTEHMHHMYYVSCILFATAWVSTGVLDSESPCPFCLLNCHTRFIASTKIQSTPSCAPSSLNMTQQYPSLNTDKVPVGIVIVGVHPRLHCSERGWRKLKLLRGLSPIIPESSPSTPPSILIGLASCFPFQHRL
jgi:hypothetical protein